MATSITKDGIQLVKQEVTEVVLDETEDLLSNEEDSITSTPFPNSEGNNTNVENNIPVIGSISSQKNNKTLNENNSKENLRDKDEIDDDDEESEGNLLIDDNHDEGIAENNITHAAEDAAEKDSSQLENNKANDYETTKGEITIVPNSSQQYGEHDDEEDEDSSEKGDKEVILEKLPRPVNELNCRQSRTYLVKLLRAANGGLNPHYGNPDMKPAFWPDYYWPWAKLTDVHTKPRGMNEPLQYR